MKKATLVSFGSKSNSCSLIGSKSNATLPPNVGYKIESNNGDDEGSKLVSLQQQGAILRSKYHRKQQIKKFPKARCCEP
jgi:hypothetical protein